MLVTGGTFLTMSFLVLIEIVFPTDGAAAAVDMRLIASTTDVESVDRAETTANNLALEHMKRVSETIPFTSKFELKLPIILGQSQFFLLIKANLRH